MIGEWRTVVVVKEKPFIFERGFEEEIGGDGLLGGLELAIAGPMPGEPSQIGHALGGLAVRGEGRGEEKDGYTEQFGADEIIHGWLYSDEFTYLSRPHEWTGERRKR